MQGLIYKVGERRNEWKCCFCCHVRTGTIFLGIWHLLLHVLALSVVAVVLRHPEIMMEQDGSSVVPTLSNIDKSSGTMDGDYTRTYSTNIISRRAMDYQNINVGVVITFFTFAITLLMVYGAIKGKPTYLMPFFCLQVFDFCIASLTAISYMFYLPGMHKTVSSNPGLPMHSELSTLSPRFLNILILMTFVLIMIIKAYFISVVWSCYKYLTLRLVAAERTIHFIDAEVPPDFQGLLPDYETAVKFSTPPPSYASATGSAVTPEMCRRDPPAGSRPHPM